MNPILMQLPEAAGKVDVKMFLVLETSGKTAADRCYYFFLFSL